MILKKLDFLEDFAAFEGFIQKVKRNQNYCDLYGSIGQESILIPDYVFDTYEDLYENYVKAKDFNLLPNIYLLEAELKKVSINTGEESKENTAIFHLREAFIHYSVSRECRKNKHMYTLRVTKILHICLLKYAAECSFIVSVKRRKEGGRKPYINQPSVGFSDYILNKIRDARLKAAMQQNWPSTQPLNNWGGEFPEFDNGGFLSNKKDKHSMLIHVKRDKARLISCQISRKTLKAINSLQAMAFSLNPLLVDFSSMENPFRILVQKDFNYELSENAELYLNRLKSLVVPLSDTQRKEQKVIYETVKLKFMDESGKVPIDKKSEFMAKFQEETNHIISEKDRKAYKRYNEQFIYVSHQKKMGKKLYLFYQMYNHFCELNFYYQAFLDFRTRVYRSGWPVGLNTGVYKYLIISSQHVTIKLEKKNYKKQLFSKKKDNNYLS